MLVFGGVRFWCKKSQSAGILLGGNKSLKVAAGTQENVPKFKVDIYPQNSHCPSPELPFI